jgi:hypothetical protein
LKLIVSTESLLCGLTSRILRLCAKPKLNWLLEPPNQPSWSRPTRYIFAYFAPSTAIAKPGDIRRLDALPPLSLARSRGRPFGGERVTTPKRPSRLFFDPPLASRAVVLPIVYGVKVAAMNRAVEIGNRGIRTMSHLTITLPSQSTSRTCGLCGRIAASNGPSLYLPDSQDTVCLDCGKEHAPELAALVDLARVAQRVGRINRHTLVPAFNELLDLARAAENYTHSAHPALRRAS